MEVSAEIYAWLSSLNIIDCIEDMKNQKEEGFYIPAKTCQLLVGGKYMEKVLINLEECYSKYYKLKLNYTNDLNNLKEVNIDDEYIPNCVKYFNWNLINECLTRFGFSFSDEQINKITSGDLNALLSVLTAVYNLSNQLIKRSNDKNFSLPATNVSINDMIQCNTSRDDKSNQSVIMPIKSSSSNNNESINLSTFNTKRDYENCTSPLELILLSLCKNFDLNPRQAIALLSNNRKYLSILCNNGINNDFSKVLLWVQTLSLYSKNLVRMVKQNPEGTEVVYSTIGSALCSKNAEISFKSALILKSIYMDIGINWEWLCREGLDAFMYCIIKHTEYTQQLFNILIEFIRQRKLEFIIELKKKALSPSDRKKVYIFISTIISALNQVESDIAKELQNYIYDICLNENKDKSLAISILSECWTSFYPIPESTATSIMNFFKSCVRDHKSNIIPLTAIMHMFIILSKFSKDKNEYAPSLFKVLVYLMIESYEDEIKRECFFINFEKFLFENQTVPIDILLSPYFSLLEKTESYNNNDLVFIFKILEHPRIQPRHIVSAISFCCKSSINKTELIRTASLILLLLFEKKFLNIVDNIDMQEIERLFISYIKTSISLYITNNMQELDIALLENPVDIMNQHFMGVNDFVYNDVVYLLKEYRKKNNKNSATILSMLWQYSTNDEVLLQLEEIHRPVYPPVAVVKKEKEREKKEIENRDFNKKTKNLLNILTIKQKNKVKKLEIDKELEIKRKETIKRSLLKVRNNIHKKLLPPIGNENILKAIKKGISIKIMSTQPSNNKSFSNMTSAISTAMKNMEKKKMFIKTNNSINTTTYNKTCNNEDDILNKYGIIYSVDKLKKIEEEQKRIKNIEKFLNQKKLILPEGTVICLDKHKCSDINSLSNMSKRVRANYKSSEVFKNFILPIKLSEEEDRETKAIEGYNKQYEKNIKYYFRTYADETTQLISKSNFLLMLREKGYNKNQINLNELTLTVHNTFDENLNEFTYNEFHQLLLQISFLIYTKIKDSLTISETYGNLLRRLVPNQETQSTIKMKKRMKPIINILKQKLFFSEQEEDANINIPPGFKVVNKTSVKYKSRLPPHFVDIIGESNYICYEILEDVIFKLFNSSTIESYVKVSDYDDIIIEPEKVKNWSLNVTKWYINVGDDNKQLGVAVSECMENMLRNVCKHKDKDGNEIIPILEKKLIINKQTYLDTENKKRELAEKRRQYLKKKVEEYREIKQLKIKQKEEERIKRYENIRKEIQNFQEHAKMLRNEVLKRRKQIEEEKINKINEKIQKKDELKKQRIQK